MPSSVPNQEASNAPAGSFIEPILTDVRILPVFLIPLPARITAEEAEFLHVRGALTLPGLALQNALLESYVEYVHPFMPLMELHDFLTIVDSPEGWHGQVSLLLYQAVMFAATAFVDIVELKKEGYFDRKAARKAFFRKVRVSGDHTLPQDPEGGSTLTCQ